MLRIFLEVVQSDGAENERDAEDTIDSAADFSF
jgi:hypothetical protein